MMAKAVLLFCAQALLVQCISSQCIGTGYGIEGLNRGPWNTGYIAEAPLSAVWAPGPCAATPYATAEWATFPPASNGGGFPVTSASPLPVTGVSMTSENVYEGPLAVSGAVPFLASVALEGTLPTAGAGAITYGCGNGEVAMLSEGINGFNAYAGPYGYGAGIAAPGYGYAPLGYEAGIAGPGYGYAPLGYEAGIAGPGYGYVPLGYEAGIAAPGYGYNYDRGCGCGAVY